MLSVGGEYGDAVMQRCRGDQNVLVIDELATGLQVCGESPGDSRYLPGEIDRVHERQQLNALPQVSFCLNPSKELIDRYRGDCPLAR